MFWSQKILADLDKKEQIGILCFNIRQALTVINNFYSLIKSRNNLSKEQLHWPEEIDKAGNKLYEEINNYQDKIVNGKIVSYKQVLENINNDAYMSFAYFIEAIKLFYKQIGKKRSEYHKSMGDIIVQKCKELEKKIKTPNFIQKKK